MGICFLRSVIPDRKFRTGCDHCILYAGADVPLSVASHAYCSTFTDRFFGGDRIVYQWTMSFTAVAAVFDFLRALPEGISSSEMIRNITESAAVLLPFSEQGFGWVCPAIAGLVIGLAGGRFRREM